MNSQSRESVLRHLLGGAGMGRQSTVRLEKILHRNVIPNSPDEQLIENLRRRRVIDHIELQHLDGTSKVYDNQRLSAAKICTELISPETLFVLLIGKCQSGKTGTMVAFIKQYLLNPDNFTPVNHIFVITGLSSTDWKRQTRYRIPDGIVVLHRNELNDDFAEKLSKMRNVLLIFDEVHIACSKKQTLSKLFQKAGIQDVQTLLERDFKCVEFCATPDGVLYNLSHPSWRNHTKILTSEPGVGYIGIYELYQQNRVLQSENLCGDDEETFQRIKDLKKIIIKYNSCRYHLFRVPGGDKSIQSNLLHIFGSTDYSYLTYDQQSDITDLNEVLSKQPYKHTFIFIKEKLRCAVTLVKTFLGILYERFSINPNDSVNVQGFAGRVAGYDINSDAIIFTNIESILHYEELYNTDFKDITIPWRSNSTRYIKSSKKTVGKQTFNHIALLSKEFVDNRKERYIEVTNFADLRKDFSRHFNNLPTNVRGPQKRKIITSDLSPYKGFYTAKIKGTHKAWSVDEIKTSTTWRGAANNIYWLYPCYINIHDSTTLRWILISKDLKPELSQEFVN